MTPSSWKRSGAGTRNSQPSLRSQLAKMVSRRKKRKAGGHEESIPSPPGYSAVPVKFSAKQQAPHYLYMRQHRVRQGTQSTWPPDRTLFILNVPPYCTQESLFWCLSCCGTIKTVELQEKPDLAESPTEPKSQFFHPKPVPVGCPVTPGSTGVRGRGWGLGGLSSRLSERPFPIAVSVMCDLGGCKSDGF